MDFFLCCNHLPLWWTLSDQKDVKIHEESEFDDNFNAALSKNKIKYSWLIKFL